MASSRVDTVNRIRIVEYLPLRAVATEGFFRILPPAIAVFGIVARVGHGASAYATHAGLAFGEDKPVQALYLGRVLLFIHIRYAKSRAACWRHAARRFKN